MLVQRAEAPDVDWVGPRRALPAAALAGVCLVAALSPAVDEEGQVLCPYRLATGGWCPGCGGTRAVRSLVRADLSGAFSLNPWAILVMAQFLVIAGWVAAAPERARTLWLRHRDTVLIANIAVALCIWAVRLWVGHIPLPF